MRSALDTCGTVFGAAFLWAAASGAIAAETKKDAVDLSSSAASGTTAPPDRDTSAASAVQIDASQDGTSASLKLNVPVHSDWIQSGWLVSAFGRGQPIPYTTTMTASASTPVSSGGKSTNLATLDGLANSTTVSIGFSQYFSPGRVLGGTDSTGATAICQSAITKYKGDHPTETHIAQDDDECGETFIRTVLGPKAAAEYRGFLYKPAPIWAYGLAVKVGYKDHTFYDATTLQKEIKNDTEPAISGYFTRISDDRTWAWSFEAQYQRSLKDNDSSTVCANGKTTPTITCVTGSIGEPKKMTSTLLALEARALIFGFGFDPMVTRDVNNSTWGVDFPIYLLGDSKLGLTSGLRAGWTSDKHHTTVGLFVTKAFSIADRSN